ncbi:hypothetical protein [Streptodolium elevatio]|uniref:Uncharacterized protein n=1 Tax=Streptodolium elevatio TaxID=3157996 RepID=A0ABV3DQA7_9ACTN
MELYAAALRQVLELRPLAEDIVMRLNPEARLADLADVIAAVDWPNPTPTPMPTPTLSLSAPDPDCSPVSEGRTSFG